MPQQFCQNCGAQLNPGDVFCQNCGAPVFTPAPNPYGVHKSSGKPAVIIAIILAVLVLAAAAFVVFKFVLNTDKPEETAKVTKQPEEEEELSAKDYLKLGNRYLRDGDYEEAILAYESAIELDEKLVDAYIGASDAYIGLERMDDAIDILQQGYDITGDDTIADVLNGLLYDREREELALDAKPALIELASLCYAGDFESVFDKMQTDEFLKIGKMSEFLDRPYIIDTDYGRIGVYEVNSDKYGNYMVYYGDYNGDIREGLGVWLGYYDSNNYFADCEWSGDAPNGYAKIREWNPNLNETVVYRIIDGTVVSGLWDGDVNWNFETTSGPSENTAVFDNGHWVVTETVGDSELGLDYRSGTIGLNEENLKQIRGIIGYGE